MHSRMPSGNVKIICLSLYASSIDVRRFSLQSNNANIWAAFDGIDIDYDCTPSNTTKIEWTAQRLSVSTASLQLNVKTYLLKVMDPH